MRKIISLLAIALIGLSGCGSKVVSDGKITTWAWDPNFNIPVMETAGTYYDTDLDFEVVEYSEDDVIQKLHTNLQAGTTENLPDIVLIADAYAQSFLQSYPDAFVALEDTIDFSQFAQYKLSSSSYNGHNYGVPFDNGATALYYRSDIIEKAGYTKEDMQNLTWREYFDIASDVYDKTGVKMMSYDLNDTALLPIMMQSAGKWYTDDSNSPESILNNEPLKIALEYTKEEVNSEWANQHVDWNSYVAGFNSGEVASVITGSWFMGNIMQEENQSGKWEVAATPRMGEVNSSVNASSVGGSSWYVLNNSGDQDAAVDFLNQVYAGNTDFYEEILRDYSAAGTYIPAFDTEEYNRKIEFFSDEPVYKLVSDYAVQITGADYMTPDTTVIEDIIHNAYLAYLDDEISIDELMQQISDDYSEQKI